MGTALAIVSMVLAVISVVLGVFAIWLSAVLYRFAADAQEKVRETANKLETAVEVLDAHVHGLHTDTFSLVKDTIADMRSALWSQGQGRQPPPGGYDAFESQLAALRLQLVGDIADAVSRGKFDRLELEQTVDRMLRRSADAGMAERSYLLSDVIRNQVTQSEAGSGMEAASLMTIVAQDFPFGLVVRTIKQMRSTGELQWEGAELTPSTIIRVGRPVVNQSRLTHAACVPYKW